MQFEFKTENEPYEERNDGYVICIEFAQTENASDVFDDSKKCWDWLNFRGEYIWLKFSNNQK